MTDITKEFEGDSLTSYPDPVWHNVPRTEANKAVWGSPWTIGRGHTGPEVHEGLTWTPQQVEATYQADKARCLEGIRRLCHIHLNQDEIDAVEDFIFNLGEQAFASSTLLRKLNVGDLAGAAAEFDKWDHAGGKVLAGLLRRREAETALFEEGMKEEGA